LFEAIREPAGADRADEIEHAHHGEHARCAHRGQPVVAAERDEMRLDEAVGAQAADEERSEQHPEQRHAGRIAQYLKRRRQQ
jgi:hypothetical protein